jgi:hypothetical protein
LKGRGRLRFAVSHTFRKEREKDGAPSNVGRNVACKNATTCSCWPGTRSCCALSQTVTTQGQFTLHRWPVVRELVLVFRGEFWYFVYPLLNRL